MYRQVFHLIVLSINCFINTGGREGEKLTFNQETKPAPPGTFLQAKEKHICSPIETLQRKPNDQKTKKGTIKQNYCSFILIHFAR